MALTRTPRSATCAENATVSPMTPVLLALYAGDMLVRPTRETCARAPQGTEGGRAPQGRGVLRPEAQSDHPRRSPARRRRHGPRRRPGGQPGLCAVDHQRDRLSSPRSRPRETAGRGGGEGPLAPAAHRTGSAGRARRRRRGLRRPENGPAVRARAGRLARHAARQLEAVCDPDAWEGPDVSPAAPGASARARGGRCTGDGGSGCTRRPRPASRGTRPAKLRARPLAGRSGGTAAAGFRRRRTARRRGSTWWATRPGAARRGGGGRATACPGDSTRTGSRAAGGALSSRR